MFNSQKKSLEIDQQLDDLNSALRPDTLDLEKRIIAQALETQPNIINTHKSGRITSWLAVPIAACFALFSVFFLVPLKQELDNNANNAVVVFDELEMQEMWLMQDQLLFDTLN